MVLSATTKGYDMGKQLPHYCSWLCASEAREAGVLKGEWIDTESDEYLDAHPDEPERCDWC